MRIYGVSAGSNNARASTLISRNVSVGGRRTSMRLEPEFWHHLARIASQNGKSIHDLVSDIAATKSPDSSLSSAVRVFVLKESLACPAVGGH